MAAVLATLSGRVANPIRVDVTIGSWVCPVCDGILLVPLFPADPDEWLAKTDHECHS